MVLDKLSSSLKNTLKKITNAMFVDEKLVNELVKDIQRSLLQSDANVKLVLEITQKIKKRALKEECPRGMSKKEFLIKIVYDELVEFLGGEGSKIKIGKKPFKIMLVGLFGSGKTTMAGKLARFFEHRDRLGGREIESHRLLRAIHVQMEERIRLHLAVRPLFVDDRPRDSTNVVTTE